MRESKTNSILKMKEKTCIVSVAFREPYVTHSKRQSQQIFSGEAYADNLVMMYCTNALPYKDGIYTDNIVEHFQKSLYGFKPHAIQRAIDAGYKKVIWFDPSVLPTVSVQVLIDALEEHPIIVRSGEEWLPKMCNAKAKNYFNVTDEEIKNEHSVAGTVYCFNFNDPKAVEVFEMWKRSEEDGIFGTQDDFMAGHWCDEACLSLAMFKCNAEKYWENKFTFLNQKEMPL